MQIFHPPSPVAWTPAGEQFYKELERKPNELLKDDGLQLELWESESDPCALPTRAAREPAVLRAFCRYAAASAVRQPGFAHLLDLEDEPRHAVTRLLLHAATCHFYAVESAAAAAAAGSSHHSNSSAAWPYDEPCSEPVFAALSLRQQFWLVSEVVTGVALG
jgi:hypothetical protein